MAPRLARPFCLVAENDLSRTKALAFTFFKSRLFERSLRHSPHGLGGLEGLTPWPQTSTSFPDPARSWLALVKPFYLSRMNNPEH